MRINLIRSKSLCESLSLSRALGSDWSLFFALALCLMHVHGVRACSILLPFRMAALVAESLATSTRKTYSKLWSDFVSIALAFRMSPLPVAAGDLEIILGHFAESKKSVPLTNAMLAAVSHAHAVAGFVLERSPRLKLLLRGIGRRYTRPAVQSLPLSPSMVIDAINLLEGDHLRTRDFSKPLLLWRTVASMVLSFSSLARFDCMSKLQLSCLQFYPQNLQIHFPSSKADQLGRGELVLVGTVSGSAYCPVLFMKAYTLRLQWEAFCQGCFPFDGPLFPALRPFRGRSRMMRTAFSRQGASKAFREVLSQMGVPNPALFTLHSGRRGGATTAAMNGCSFLSIKRQGRWKSDSCPQRYIDEATTRINNFSRFLGL